MWERVRQAGVRFATLSEEQLRQHEEFMAAYRPYHDTGDDAFLWQWIEQQIG